MLTHRSDIAPLPMGRSGKPLDIFGFAGRYGLLALVLGAFLFCMLIPGVLMISRPNYEVSAALKIDPVVPSLITKSEDPSIINYFHDYARTQAKRLKEYEVLAETIRRLSLEERSAVLPKGLGIEKAAFILERIIQITPEHRTHLIRLSAAGPDPKGLAPVLNHLMAVFLEKIRTEATMKDHERLSYLAEKRQEITTAITGLEENLQALSGTIHTASFSEDFNVMQQRSQQLQKLAVEVFGERVAAEKSYGQTQVKIEKLKALSLDAMVDEVVMKDQSIDFTSSWTYQQLQQLRSSIDGITPGNPDRVRVEQRMKAMRNYENQLRREVRNTADKILKGKREYELGRELMDADKRLKSAREAEADILAALDKSQHQAARISSGLIEGDALQQQLNHSRDLLFRIDTRIHELMVESKAPLRISIESRARQPVSPTGSNTKKLFILCLAASFGLAGGSLLLYDFLDNRIRSPKNIQQALGCPPTWPISGAPEGVDFSRLMTQAPNCQPAKAIRSLAVRLNREREQNQARVFLFTGVDPGAGCSGISLNCARSLAALTQKVLLVTSAPAAAVPPAGSTRTAQGLHAFMSGQTSYTKAIVRDPESGIHIMPLGAGLGGRKDSRRMQAFIRQAQKRYDAVCIDADPVLRSDLTEYLAVQAHVVVLISQGDSTLFRDLHRAAGILVRLEVPAIAPVLNWGGKRQNSRVDALLDSQTAWVRRLQTRSRTGRDKKE